MTNHIAPPNLHRLLSIPTNVSLCAYPLCEFNLLMSGYQSPTANDKLASNYLIISVCISFAYDNNKNSRINQYSYSYK